MNPISVIIVEDEAMTAMFMTTVFRRKGFNVLGCVSSGEESVDISLKLTPDVVIMDIRLAGKMNGVEAVTQIKAESGETIQFVFASGYSDEEMKDQANKLNPIAFFTKPVNPSELINVIELFFSDRKKLSRMIE